MGTGRSAPSADPADPRLDRRPIRLSPRPFPAAVQARLRARLALAHASDPFSPTDARAASHRVALVATDLGLAATLFRGGLDVGGAELDHVWVVVDDRVVDAAFPLFAARFVALLRGYVAGDVDVEDLDRSAHPYSVDWRVIGAFPDDCRYVGAPVWGAR